MIEASASILGEAKVERVERLSRSTRSTFASPKILALASIIHTHHSSPGH